MSSSSSSSLPTAAIYPQSENQAGGVSEGAGRSCGKGSRLLTDNMELKLEKLEGIDGKDAREGSYNLQPKNSTQPGQPLVQPNQADKAQPGQPLMQPNQADQAQLPGRSSSVQKDTLKDFAETTMNEMLSWYGYDKLRGAGNPRKPPTDLTPATSPLTGVRLPSRSDALGGSSPGEEGMETEGGDWEGHVGRGKDWGRSCQVDGDQGGGQVYGGQGSQGSGRRSASRSSPRHSPDNSFKKRSSEPDSRSADDDVVSLVDRRHVTKTKLCDWCKISPAVIGCTDSPLNGLQELDFCTDSCLNQYKMSVFCAETQQHLRQLENCESAEDGSLSGGGDGGGGVSGGSDKILITPDLWLKQQDDAAIHKKQRKRKRCDSPIEPSSEGVGQPGPLLGAEPSSKGLAGNDEDRTWSSSTCEVIANGVNTSLKLRHEMTRSASILDHSPGVAGGAVNSDLRSSSVGLGGRPHSLDGRDGESWGGGGGVEERVRGGVVGSRGGRRREGEIHSPVTPSSSPPNISVTSGCNGKMDDMARSINITRHPVTSRVNQRPTASHDDSPAYCASLARSAAGHRSIRQADNIKLVDNGLARRGEGTHLDMESEVSTRRNVSPRIPRSHAIPPGETSVLRGSGKTSSPPDTVSSGSVGFTRNSSAPHPLNPNPLPVFDPITLMRLLHPAFSSTTSCWPSGAFPGVTWPLGVTPGAGLPPGLAPGIPWQPGVMPGGGISGGMFGSSGQHGVLPGNFGPAGLFQFLGASGGGSAHPSGFTDSAAAAGAAAATAAASAQAPVAPPSWSGLVPPATLMVPYPIVIPLPLPIPVPFPVPMSALIRARSSSSSSSSAGAESHLTSSADIKINNNNKNCRSPSTAPDQHYTRESQQGGNKTAPPFFSAATSPPARCTCQRPGAFLLSSDLCNCRLHGESSTQSSDTRVTSEDARRIFGHAELATPDVQCRALDFSVSRNTSSAGSRCAPITARATSSHDINMTLPIVVKTEPSSSVSDSPSPHGGGVVGGVAGGGIGGVVLPVALPYSARRSLILDAPCVPQSRDHSPPLRERHVNKKFLYCKRRPEAPGAGVSTGTLGHIKSK